VDLDVESLAELKDAIEQTGDDYKLNLKTSPSLKDVLYAQISDILNCYNLLKRLGMGNNQLLQTHRDMREAPHRQNGIIYDQALTIYRDKIENSLDLHGEVYEMQKSIQKLTQDLEYARIAMARSNEHLRMDSYPLRNKVSRIESELYSLQERLQTYKRYLRKSSVIYNGLIQLLDDKDGTTEVPAKIDNLPTTHWVEVEESLGFQPSPPKSTLEFLVPTFPEPEDTSNLNN
jgi:gamma-glutamylcyclotransferase (GGCT)/AIG2-like uncharacterized protein YtfP